MDFSLQYIGYDIMESSIYVNMYFVARHDNNIH
jgi:hypothetical protein